MKAKKLFTMMAILFVSLTVIAQEMPAAQKNLMQLVGTWTSTDIKMTMGGKTYGGEFVVKCEAVNGNTGIHASEKFTNDELGTMLAEDLFGYDPNLQQIHMYTIDNMGTTHDHVGYWIDDHHLFVEYQGVVEGKMYVEQVDMVIANANTMNFKLTGMLNGEIVQSATGTYKK
jgi:hypothetical protein